MGSPDDRADAHALPPMSRIGETQSGDDRDGDSLRVDMRTLGTKERQLLRTLLAKQGRVVPRSELARVVGLRESERRVDVHLVTIRRLLGDKGLVNVRGRGWMVPADFDETGMIETMDATDQVSGFDSRVQFAREIDIRGSHGSSARDLGSPVRDVRSGELG